jgi:hypothetical protein
MTIREYIQSRVRLLRIIRLGWAVVPITVILIFPKWAKTFGVYLVGFAYVAMIAAWSVGCFANEMPTMQ